jgi:hypothetical protein
MGMIETMFKDSLDERISADIRAMERDGETVLTPLHMAVYGLLVANGMRGTALEFTAWMDGVTSEESVEMNPDLKALQRRDAVKATEKRS